MKRWWVVPVCTYCHRNILCCRIVCGCWTDVDRAWAGGATRIDERHRDVARKDEKNRWGSRTAALNAVIAIRAPLAPRILSTYIRSFAGSLYFLSFSAFNIIKEKRKKSCLAACHYWCVLRARACLRAPCNIAELSLAGSSWRGEVSPRSKLRRVVVNTVRVFTLNPTLIPQNNTPNHSSIYQPLQHCNHKRVRHPNLSFINCTRPGMLFFQCEKLLQTTFFGWEVADQ